MTNKGTKYTGKHRSTDTSHNPPTYTRTGYGDHRADDPSRRTQTKN